MDRGDHLRARQCAGEAVQRDRGSRRGAAPGARARRRAHPVPAALRGVRRSRGVRRHRSRVRGGRRDRRAHEGGARSHSAGAQPRDLRGRVRSHRSARPDHVREELLPAPRGQVGEGVRAAAAHARADRPHGHRAVRAAAENADRGPPRARRRARRAESAVARRGARSGVPRTRRAGAHHGEGAAALGGAREELQRRLRRDRLPRRIPGGAAPTGARQTRSG